ncbi:MAG: tetratricopeptide repeat protein [Candidatus Coatesbacteria bacterium]|nr:tetratricopeptide repeat protein [Candidatus Coatesbacteria bacterium]
MKNYKYIFTVILLFFLVFSFNSISAEEKPEPEKKKESKEDESLGGAPKELIWDIDKQFKQALYQYQIKEYQVAVDRMENLARKLNDYPKAALRLEIMFFVAEGKYKLDLFTQAGSYYEKILVDFPKDDRYVPVCVYRLLWISGRTENKEKLTKYYDMIQQDIRFQKYRDHAKYILAEYYLKLKEPDYNKAISILQSIAYTGPVEIQQNSLVAMGMAYWKLDKISDAVTAFQKAKNIRGPGNPEARGRASYFLGNYWYSKEQFDKAKDDYLDVDEDAGIYYHKALSGLGWSYLKLKEFNKSIKYFSLLLTKTKEYNLAGESATMIGHCQYRLGEYDKAIETFKRVMKEYPKQGNDPDDRDWSNEARYEIILPYYGLFLKAREKYGTSKKDWGKIEEPAKYVLQYTEDLISQAKDKKHRLLVYAYFYKAEILTYQEKYEDAIKVYEDICSGFQDSPFYKDALWGLGWAYYFVASAKIEQENISVEEATRLMNYTVKAIKSWEILLDKFPDFPSAADAAIAAGEAYVNILPAFDKTEEGKDDSKYWKMALPFYDKAIRLKNITPIQKFRLTLLFAIAYMKQGEYERAVQYMTDAFNQAPAVKQESEAVDKAAVLFTQHAESKKDNTGVVLFQKYLQLKPDATRSQTTKQVMDKMAGKYETLFKYDRAINTLKLMNNLYPNDPNIASVHWRIGELSKTSKNMDGWQNAMESFLDKARTSTDKDVSSKVNVALFEVTSKIREKLSASKTLDEKSKGEYEKMMKLSSEYLARNPNSRTIEYYAMLVNLGDAQMALQQSEPAGDTFLKLATELEQNFPPNFLKGIEAFKDKTKQDYIQFCVRNAFSCYHDISLLADKTKNTTQKQQIIPKLIKAAEFYEKIGTNNKDLSIIMSVHADALLELKQWDNAMVVYNNFLQRFPTEVDNGLSARQNIAYCYQMKKQWIDAAKAFMEVERFARLNGKKNEAVQAIEAAHAQYWLIAYPNAAEKTSNDTTSKTPLVKGDVMQAAGYLRQLTDYAVLNGYPEQAKKIMGNVLRIYNDQQKESAEKAIQYLQEAQVYCKSKGFEDLVKAANGYIILIYTNQAETAYKTAEENKIGNVKAQNYILSAQWEQKKAEYIKTTTGVVKEEEKIIYWQNTAGLYSKAAKALEDKGEGQTGEDKAQLQNMYMKIIDLYEQIIKQTKDEKLAQDYRSKIVYIMRKTNKWKEAAQMIHQMAEKESDQKKKIDYYLAEIDTYKEHKDLETVQKLMKEYVNRFPGDKEHTFDFAATIALLYYDKGDYVTAEPEMKKAISVYSNQEDTRIALLHYNLGEIMEKKSGFEAANKEWYTKVLTFPVPELHAKIFYKQANIFFDEVKRKKVLDSNISADTKAKVMLKIGDAYAKVVKTINAAIDKNPSYYQQYANTEWYKKSLEMAKTYTQDAEITSKAGEAVKNILEIKDDFGRQATEARKKWYQKMFGGN